MHILIIALSIFGLAFLIKETDGPGGIIAWVRNKLLQNKYVGVFFYKLLSCYFCTGMYCGAAIYLLSQSIFQWNLLFLWSLAGGVICLVMDGLMNKLHS
jgi:hypothetical protein